MVDCSRSREADRVTGDPVTEAEVRAVGVMDFRPWVDAPHHVTRDVADDYIRDWEVRSPIRVLGNLMDTLMVKPAPLFASEITAYSVVVLPLPVGPVTSTMP